MAQQMTGVGESERLGEGGGLGSRTQKGTLAVQNAIRAERHPGDPDLSGSAPRQSSQERRIIKLIWTYRQTTWR
jgi:hypothetical protein